MEQLIYPYPYRRVEKDKTIQLIRLFVCLDCGKYHYVEIRNGKDFGGQDIYYLQQYKYGLYQYKDTTKIYKRQVQGK